VVPTFEGWDLRPPISNHTLRGSNFFEPLARAARGVTLTRGGTVPLNGCGRGSGRARRARLFRRRSRARSGRHGGGRDGTPRPFAVMIARVRSSGRFSTVGPTCQRQTMSPAVNGRGARGSRERGSPRSINHERGRSESLTLPLSICCPCFLLFPPGCALPWLCPCSFHPRAAASLASSFRLQWLHLSPS
jgi:hypothetical protein